MNYGLFCKNSSLKKNIILAVKAQKKRSEGIEKKIDNTDFEEYVETATSICTYRKELTNSVLTIGHSKIFQTGRVCLFQEVIPAVVLSRSGQTVSILYNKPQIVQQAYEKDILFNGKYQSPDSIDPVVKTIQLTRKCPHLLKG
jgi:hypothetical protein